MLTNFNNSFTVIFSKSTADKGGIKTTTSPEVCCGTTLRNWNAQLYNFTIKLFNLIWWKKCLISINVYQECYLLVRISMHINLQHVFKMSASRTHACFEANTPLVNGCDNDVLFNAAPNVQQTLSQFVNISIYPSIHPCLFLRKVKSEIWNLRIFRIFVW